MPSESLILKVLPIEVDGLIDLGGLALAYIWIEFDNTKNLDEVLRNARLCFEQYKQRNDLSKVWKEKKHENFIHHNKLFHPTPFRNMVMNPRGSTFSRNKQIQKKKDKAMNFGPIGDVGMPKETLN